MYNLQFSEFTMDPRNQRQFLPPLLYVNPFMMQQLIELQTNTRPSCVGFYSLPFDIGPAYQRMAQHHCHQYRSGPSSNQCRKRFRKAETQHRYNVLHESSGTIIGDRSTGIHPGHAQIGANDNSGGRKVWRTPPRNPSMLTTTQPSRYERNHITDVVLVGPGRGVPTR